MQQLLGKAPLAGTGLKSYLSSGKSSAIAINFRPISFQLSSRACDGPTAGFGGASFFIVSCAAASTARIPYHKNHTNDSLFHFEIPPKSPFSHRDAASRVFAGGKPRLYSSPALPSISRNCFCVRISIDCADQLSFAVVDKTFRYPLHHKHFVYLPPGIE